MSLIPPDRLNAFVASRSEGPDDRPVRIPYPTASGVLYDDPNPDGSRKRCGNCWKFVVEGRCLEVHGDIDPAQVCGTHVFGKPQVTDLAMYTGAADGAIPVRKLSPQAAGLIWTPNGEGTSCELCRFYEPNPDGSDDGLCNAVGSNVDGLPPVIVDAYGCCARWEAAPTR